MILEKYYSFCDAWWRCHNLVLLPHPHDFRIAVALPSTPNAAMRSHFFLMSRVIQNSEECHRKRHTVHPDYLKSHVLGHNGVNIKHLPLNKVASSYDHSWWTEETCEQCWWTKYMRKQTRRTEEMPAHCPALWLSLRSLLSSQDTNVWQRNIPTQTITTK